MPGRTRTELRVCRTADLPPGTSKIVKTDRGRSIAVFNVNGNYFAVGTICPHQGGPIEASKATGTTQTRSTPEGYQAEWVRDGEIIRCGWHLYEFEIATGRALTDPDLRIATYPVRLVCSGGEHAGIPDVVAVDI